MEAALSTAVNALVVEKPADPLTFLSNHFAIAARGNAPTPPPPVQHETHVTARSQDNPQYHARQSVPDALVPWREAFPG